MSTHQPHESGYHTATPKPHHAQPPHNPTKHPTTPRSHHTSQHHPSPHPTPPQHTKFKGPTEMTPQRAPHASPEEPPPQANQRTHMRKPTNTTHQADEHASSTENTKTHTPLGHTGGRWIADLPVLRGERQEIPTVRDHPTDHGTRGQRTPRPQSSQGLHPPQGAPERRVARHKDSHQGALGQEERGDLHDT